MIDFGSDSEDDASILDCASLSLRLPIMTMIDSDQSDDEKISNDAFLSKLNVPFQLPSLVTVSKCPPTRPKSTPVQNASSFRNGSYSARPATASVVPPLFASFFPNPPSFDVDLSTTDLVDDTFSTPSSASNVSFFAICFLASYIREHHRVVTTCLRSFPRSLAQLLPPSNASLLLPHTLPPAHLATPAVCPHCPHCPAPATTCVCVTLPNAAPVATPTASCSRQRRQQQRRQQQQQQQPQESRQLQHQPQLHQHRHRRDQLRLRCCLLPGASASSRWVCAGLTWVQTLKSRLLLVWPQRQTIGSHHAVCRHLVLRVFFSFLFF